MKIYYLHNCRSTQRWAKEREEEAVFVCGSQSGGVGREGRPWFSPPELGLYFTISARLPEKTPPTSLPLIFAQGVKEWLEREFGLRPRIKEPNDILINGRKICGILVERRRERIAAGIGINLNHQQEDFPYYLRKTATSVFLETGKKLHPLSTLPALLNYISKHFPLT